MMPAWALVGVPGPRWLPPVPLPLFLVWPLVFVCLGIAKLLARENLDQATKLGTAMAVFCELRGLVIDVEAQDSKPVKIRFV